MTKPIIAIVGPTAVGKSAVADRLACTLDGAVVSVDAMQVYRGMDIGTAKTPAGERRAPLLMVDVVNPVESYSAARYQRDARTVIDALLSADIVPVLCGGTGLYLRAALDEMNFPSGHIDTAQRAAYERIAAEQGAEALHALLAQRDPASAQEIHPHNVRRVVRALEMLDDGVSYAHQRSGFSEQKPRYPARYFGLSMERERLYERINRRVDTMMDNGLLDEVRSLLDMGAGPALTARQAIGYKELIDYLDGATSLSEAIDTIKVRSRRYAKRQLSWFRRDPRIIWISLDDTSVEDAVAFIEQEVDAR